ncbi:purine-nucleoside phosphorylase [Candidatus Riflebacteria bacterium]
MKLFDRLKESRKFLASKTGLKPEWSITLGTGLAALVRDIEVDTVVSFKDIPHFPQSTVSGHEGKIYFGKLEGRALMAFSGRIHYYEGFSMEEVTYPVRVARAMGVSTGLFTNAAGALNRLFKPGDLSIITDHINWQPNPLIGPNDERLGPRFVALFPAYNPEHVELMEEISVEEGINARKGVHVAVTGPSYCSSAELRMLRLLGADTIGMSTVPEVIVAWHAGFSNVLGLACVTDMATGEGHEEVSHEIVIQTAKKAEEKFCRFVKKIIARLDIKKT